MTDIVDDKFSYKKWIDYSFSIFDDMVTIAEKKRQRRVQYGNEKRRVFFFAYQIY